MATTTEQIVIRGDLVEIEQRTVLRSMPLADLIPLIAVPPPMTFPRLPLGTRFARIDPGDQRMMLIVEVQPKIQTMRTARHQATYRLTMPYQYYCFTATAQNIATDSHWRMENWHLFWSAESLVTPDQPVIPAMLPNIYQDRGVICFGTTQPNSNQTLSQRIDQIVNEFSVTVFNGDLGWNRPSAYRSFAHWASESTRDPLGWRQWPEWVNAQPLSSWILTATQTIRPTDAQAVNAIPEITTGWTFGRAAEWLEQLNAQDRYRLIRVLSDRRDMTVRLPAFDPDDYPVEATEEPAAEPEPEATPDEVGTEPFIIMEDEEDDEDDADELNEMELARADEIDVLPDALTTIVNMTRAQATAAERHDTADVEPRCACDYLRCACERVVLNWMDTCQACIGGRHSIP